jgi:hypothetical protein
MGVAGRTSDIGGTSMDRWIVLLCADVRQRVGAYAPVFGGRAFSTVAVISGPIGFDGGVEAGDDLAGWGRRGTW